ncbi:uncharacterized protein LOC119372547 isoform X2 [Rhipicephalus sanguineus]|uniref:uncharacterized protein LOC119372547 isoform X2 n=1 Tax=Rhipicephalus sanguineus TaxID=34632 RepID=UPI0020C31BD8|nr:uncharacterized protein LOC119372547 isoform X2 [Rhipicephalus sanguineus]
MAANVNRAAVGDDKTKKKKLRGRRYCCVYKCHNQEGFDSSVSFYTFPSRPYEKERRQRWIQAVRRAGPDGESWQPNSNTRICSRHFSGNARSNIMQHPAYVPTIFPSAYRRTVPCDPSAPTERFQRWQKRPRDQTKSPSEEKVKDTTSSTGASHQLQLCPDLTDESISLELVESTDDQQGELLHATMEEEMHEDAATSCSSTSAERLPSLLHHAVGPSARVCFFGGFDTVSLTPGAVRDLCGVCDNVFAMLLGLLPEVRDKTTDVSLPNKLLIFLFKMKHGLPFSAIAVLFGIHETTVSRIFHAVLGTLATATRKWIYKPQMHVIKDTRPECFKLNYPECTVIVDCTEVRTETPSEVRQQHVLFSTYKNGFTLKFLVAIAPSGFIVFKSKSYGGRCSDTQIVLESGFLDIICQNDVILADKGFPGILAGVVGKSAVLIMPPFSTGSQPFTPQELKQTYNVAQVRVHVERVIQRIKIHGILVNRVPISLIPAMSDIFHMCCVLANLQSSIIQSGGK